MQEKTESPVAPGWEPLATTRTIEAQNGLHGEGELADLLVKCHTQQKRRTVTHGAFIIE
jgi:hypothetical protein